MRSGKLVLSSDGDAGSGHSDGENLSGLIESAQLKEWRDSLDLHARLLVDDENPSSNIELVHRLQQMGPWQLTDPTAVDAALLQLPSSIHAFFQATASEARKIVTRRTVFLVPEYQPELVRSEQQRLSELLSAIGREMAKMSASTQSAPYSFLRLRTNRHQPHPSQGLMTQLVRNMMVWTSSLKFEERKHYLREGPLLMDGPTGAGKTLAAEQIALQHKKRIIKVNIAGINDDLLEGRMRGYCKGAFTGAVQEHDGWFAQADGGILFLDEFQNASLASQTQLLDLLDPVSNEVVVTRIGDEVARRFRVKVILAVNKPIHELLTTGRIREDLFYRIRDVVTLKSFNELVSSCNDREVSARLSGWIHTYRWKSAPYLGVDFDDPIVQEDDCVSLFPEFDANIITLIREFDWSGNFRQFERVLTNIFWDNDEQRQAAINYSSIQRELRSENYRLGKNIIIRPQESAGAEALRKRTALVEQVLARNHLVISSSLKELKDLRVGLGSRQTLRAFLIANFDHFSASFRSQAPVRKFLKMGLADGTIAQG